jgi:hypothetical protein
MAVGARPVLERSLMQKIDPGRPSMWDDRPRMLFSRRFDDHSRQRAKASSERRADNGRAATTDWKTSVVA